MKERRMVDARVVCEQPNWVTRYCRTPEATERALNAWVREFEDFLRDHRSQDMISLTVEREYEEVCSFCGDKWEEDDDGVPLCCDDAQVEWAKSNGFEL